MRGPGDFFSQGSSIRQSGDSGFDIANKCKDSAFAMRVFECARDVLALDPHLEKDKNKLTSLYEEGYNDAKELYDDIINFIE